MKGTTTLTFNQTTMVEALQMYLDAQLSSNHKVASVKATTGAGYANDGSFEIIISEPEAKTA